MLPILLNLAASSVLVVGGGAVGRRKAGVAARDGARVRVLDPLPRPPDFDDHGVEWIASAYDKAWLAGVACVFACATAEVNAVVVADALACGLLVSDAAVPERGNFTLPAVATSGLTFTGTVTPVAGDPAPYNNTTTTTLLLDELFAGHFE